MNDFRISNLFSNPAEVRLEELCARNPASQYHTAIGRGAPKSRQTLAQKATRSTAVSSQARTGEFKGSTAQHVRQQIYKRLTDKDLPQPMD